MLRRMKMTNDDNYPTSIIIHDTRAVLVNAINARIKKKQRVSFFLVFPNSSDFVVVFFYRT